LLAAEITARTGRDPAEHYRDLTRELGEPAYERIDAPASPEEKAVLQEVTAGSLGLTELAGEPIQAVLTAAPDGGQPIGGVKIVTEHGWCAARPSGTEAVYKLYAESFKGDDHLRRIQEEAQVAIQAVFAGQGRRRAQA
jgi:phosphoglucomutase